MAAGWCGAPRRFVGVVGRRDLVVDRQYPGSGSDDYWPHYIGAHASVAHHQARTCRIGDDGGAVVDADLRACGIEGLRVADSSVMLAPVSGNTQAAAYVVGAKAVGLCLADTD
jgi:choline dehydrogenase-like flavoprotein